MPNQELQLHLLKLLKYFTPFSNLSFVISLKRPRRPEDMNKKENIYRNYMSGPFHHILAWRSSNSIVFVRISSLHLGNILA